MMERKAAGAGQEDPWEVHCRPGSRGAVCLGTPTVTGLAVLQRDGEATEAAFDGL